MTHDPNIPVLRFFLHVVGRIEGQLIDNWAVIPSDQDHVVLEHTSFILGMNGFVDWSPDESEITTDPRDDSIWIDSPAFGENDHLGITLDPVFEVNGRYFRLQEAEPGD